MKKDEKPKKNLAGFLKKKQAVTNTTTVDTLKDLDIGNYQLAVNLLKVSIKSKEETDKLVQYFTHSKSNFMNILKQNSEKLEELVFNLCSNMQYLFVPKNTVLFKTGDPGDFFYVVIHGSVSVILPEEGHIELTEEEYLNYLMKLKINLEHDIFNRVLNNEQNGGVLAMEFNNFDKYLLDNFDYQTNTFNLREKRKVINSKLVDMIKLYITSAKKRNSYFGRLTSEEVEELQTLENNKINKIHRVTVADELGEDENVVEEVLSIFKKPKASIASQDTSK